MKGCEARVGLNRTSVGLKRQEVKMTWQVRSRPQSNQRGIETHDPHGGLQGVTEPQSNQRGIETGAMTSGTTRGKPGLNRTSVGLKPGAAV